MYECACGLKLASGIIPNSHQRTLLCVTPSCCIAQANAYQGWQNAAVTSPKLFWFAILLAVAEIIASIIIVKQSWELECDKILTTFVIGFTSRYFVLLPILIHRYYNQEQPVDTGIQSACPL